MSEIKFKGKPASYYESLDKRKKEYKQYKTWLKIKNEQVVEPIEIKNEVGLGDVVEKITEATGIKKAVKKLFGEDCGCENRKQKMNSSLSYFSKRRGNPLEANEYEFLVGTYFNKKQGEKHNRSEMEQMQKIFNRVFNYSPRTKFKTCGSCVTGMEKNLKKVLEYYDNELKNK